MKKLPLLLTRRIAMYSFIGLLLQCIVLSAAFASGLRAQNMRELEDIQLKVEFNEEELSSVFQKITSLTQVHFTYDKNNDFLREKFSFPRSVTNLKDLLLKISYNNDLGFRRLNESISVRKIERPVKERVKEALKDIRISGRVTSLEDDEPIPGVNVVVKGTSVGAITDIDGNYAINVPDENAVLIFSFIGYLAEEVAVGNQSTIDVNLSPDITQLEEIVVVGYGTVKKKDLTGAVASVDNEKYETLPNTNITQALRGSVPGVRITAGGNAGSGSGISVRGQNSINGGNDALIVVDGIIYNGQIGNLNPNDIASIDILKDASSTAIFGARAANGVVLITTKRGKTAKPTIQFNSYIGIQDFLMTQDFETPEEYVQKKIDYQRTLHFRGVAPEPDVSNPVLYLNDAEVDNYNNGRIIDPLDVVTQAAPIQSYNLNIGAKTENTSYYIAGSWTDQQGKVIGDQFKRASFRINLETEITDWLKFGTNSNFSFVDVSNEPASLNHAFWLSPYATWYLDEEETVLNPLPMTDGLVSNPLLPTLEDRTRTRRDLFGIFYGEIEVPFVKGLSYRFTYSHDILTSKDYHFVPSFNAGGLNRVASGSDNLSESQDMFLENLIKYNRTVAEDHTFDVTLLYNYNKATNTGLNANANTFPSEVLNYYSLSLGENQTTNAGYSDYRAIAMMARLNYKFKDRYLLTLTGRRDGASLFSENNKYAFFPSMALGWVMSDERFMLNSDFVDFMKLRVSYGANGNQSIDRYESLSRISPDNDFNYLFDGATAFGIAKTSLGNKDLKWETTYATNLGIDFGFLKSKISGSLNLYNSNTEDLLLARNIPNLNGFSSILSNLGSVNNKGIELNLSTINIDKNSLQWTTGLNFALNRNKIVHLYGEKDADGNELDDISNEWFIGESLGALYDYETNGIWQEGEDIPDGFRPGDFEIVDQDGDGEISPDDRIILGFDRPDFSIGFNTTLRYRGFSLYALFSSEIGGVRDNAQLLNPARGWHYRVRHKDIDWWTPSNPSEENPSLDYQDSYSLPFLQSTTYVRIQDVSLSYDFSTNFLQPLNLERLQVYISAKNPVLFTNWGGWDPETTGSGRGQYPTMKSITAGINLSL